MSRGVSFSKALRRMLAHTCRGAVIPWSVLLSCHRLARGLTGEASPLLPTADELTLAQQCIEDPFIRDALYGLKLTCWGLDVDSVNWVVRYMRQNRIQRVLEFGSGLSTLMFASCCRENYNPAEAPGSGRVFPLVVSIEQDAAYAQQTRALIAKAELEGAAQVVHCPLVERSWERATVQGYRFDAGTLSHLPSEWAADLVFVDGPATDGWGRAVAVLDSLSYAAPRCRLIMDDAFREEEMGIVSYLKRNSHWVFRGVAPVGKGLAVATLGK